MDNVDNWDDQKIKCHTCCQCGQFYQDHDYLCSDDVCVDCHGGLVEYLECDMRHFFLMATQCMNITFRPETTTVEEYNQQIENITKHSMAVVRNIVKFAQKYHSSFQTTSKEVNVSE